MPFGNPNHLDRLPVRLRGTPKKSEHPLESQQENLNLTCWASKYHQDQTHRNQHCTGNSNRGVKSQSMPSAKSVFPKPPAEYSTITERHNHRRKGKGQIFQSLLAHFNMDRLCASNFCQCLANCNLSVTKRSTSILGSKVPKYLKQD